MREYVDQVKNNTGTTSENKMPTGKYPEDISSGVVTLNILPSIEYSKLTQNLPKDDYALEENLDFKNQLKYRKDIIKQSSSKKNITNRRKNSQSVSFLLVYPIHNISIKCIYNLCLCM